MVVAFLNLLGTKNLLEWKKEVADDNMKTIDGVIRTKIVDARTDPLEGYKECFPDNDFLLKNVEKASITSFKHIFKSKDTLVLGAENVSLFVKQLSNFVANLYIESSKPFIRKFNDIEAVESDRYFSRDITGKLVGHKVFPILYRGGLSFDETSCFIKEEEEYTCDRNNYHEKYNKNDPTYLKAVELEHIQKGPRLFCDKSVVDELEDKSMIRYVDKQKDIYEIVWTVEGCEATGCSKEEKYNVADRIKTLMLPAAINLYCYYLKIEAGQEILDHYKELLELVCRGIVRYADIKCIEAEDALKEINKKLDENNLEPYTMEDLMEGFLDKDDKRKS